MTFMLTEHNGIHRGREDLCGTRVWWSQRVGGGGGPSVMVTRGDMYIVVDYCM